MLRLGSLPPVTTALVVVNILIFAYGTLGNTQNEMISQYGFVPNGLFKDGYIGDSIVRMFTSMFIHANIAHIGFNMFALAYMGGFAERSIGKPKYVALYLLAGLGGALFDGVISSYALGNGDSILIGASGAISGIMGISAAMGDIRGYYWFAIQVLFVFIGSFASLSIAFAAHVGGFITGLGVTKLLIESERRKRNPYRGLT
ncbi:MAG: rhomboid family intramembrane serine protease [Thaumarchaeota archaeon]|nr:rhomboid family intramembrane serine protease [Nitrososphaerota archaeon]MDE1818577.1 rhomboid family intramembrane serine protease [Nitrososphaerota archaeon]MDE1875249.1 rhomboid family intramembrane serine protease [Nitrososphaerota archaeon]